MRAKTEGAFTTEQSEAQLATEIDLQFDYLRISDKGGPNNLFRIECDPENATHREIVNTYVDSLNIRNRPGGNA